MGGKTQTTKVKLDPLMAEQAEYALGESRSIYDQMGAQGLPGMYTGIDPNREAAMQQMLQTANQGQVAGAAMPEWQKTVGGGYLDTANNPHLQDIVNRSVGSAMGSQVGQFAGSGRFGGGAMANAMADIGQRTASNLYSDQYNRERQNQMRALQGAGAMQQLQYADPMMAGRVGQEYEQDAAAQQQEQMRQYLFPQANLSSFQGQLGQNPLMAQTKTITSQPFDWGGFFAGMAQTGASQGIVPI